MPTEQTMSTSGLEVLCSRLSDTAGSLMPTKRGRESSWSGAWKLAFSAGLLKRNMVVELADTKIIEGYLALSRSCLTTTFILTQWHAACRRIAAVVVMKCEIDCCLSLQAVNCLQRLR